MGSMVSNGNNFRFIRNCIKYEGGGYKYYHLISGTSLPIKNQDIIHDFFDRKDQDLLYFHINNETHKVIQDRVRAFYPFINTKFFRKSKLIKGLSYLLGKTEILFGIDRLRRAELKPIYNGWTWFSVPHDFAKFAVKKRELLEKTFNFTVASDETWIQTLAVHSKFKDRIYGLNGKNDPLDASKHFIDWKRGKPYIFRLEDYDLLMKDNRCFFARKFDENIDKKIVEKIVSDISEQQRKD